MSPNKFGENNVTLSDTDFLKILNSVFLKWAVPSGAGKNLTLEIRIELKFSNLI